MHQVIGIKYEGTRAKLRDMVRLRAISTLEAQAKNHQCYFCSNHIDGKMWVLTLYEPNGKSEFYIDDVCYKSAKSFMYYNGIPVSLN